MNGSPLGAQAEEIVLHLLYQLLVILLTTRAVAWFCRKFLGQTDVAGEILAGLILGPSLLGALAPDLMHRLFDPATAPIFTGISQIGLVLLMFQIGLEFEFKANVSSSMRTVIAISLSGIVLPFTLGFLSAPWFYAQMPEPLPPEFGFRLFFATAMSITAIPILGRIFLELGLSHTRTAAITIAAAAIDDVVGWLLLGVTAAIVTTKFEVKPFLIRVGLLVTYVLAVFYLLRSPLKKKIHQHIEKDGQLTNRPIAFLLILLFASGTLTSNLGVFAIIGGFVIGVALHDDRVFVNEWRTRVSPLVQTFFLPVFFTYTGLRTDISKLTTGDLILQAALVCLVAFVGKLGGAYTAGRLSGEDHRTALTIGVCMNTRGLMELIAVNIGYDLGVIPREMFTMLVIMAIASTYIATPLIRHLMPEERLAQKVSDI